jgi:hypothetical protein
MLSQASAPCASSASSDISIADDGSCSTIAARGQTGTVVCSCDSAGMLIERRALYSNW